MHDIVIYELLELGSESIVLPVIHAVRSKKRSYNSAPSLQRFGIPFYIVLRKEERRELHTIYDKLGRCYSQISDSFPAMSISSTPEELPSSSPESLFSTLFTIRVQKSPKNLSVRSPEMTTRFQTLNTLYDTEEILSSRGSPPDKESSESYGMEMRDTSAREGNASTNVTPRFDLQSGDTLVVSWSSTTFNDVFGQKHNAYWEGRMVNRKSIRGQDHVELDDCLDEFARMEDLTGQRAWYCPRCQEHVDAKTRLQLWRIPDVLIVHSWEECLHLG